MKSWIIGFFLFFFSINSFAQAWSEDFEGAWPPTGWSISTGVWGQETEFGHESQRSAATVPGGNYPDGVSSRLVTHSFQVPLDNPRLRFWHWYSFAAGDFGWVEVKVQGGDWEVISTDYTNTSSNMWTYPSLDLSGYAGQTIQVGFYFESTNWGGGPVDVSSGWYIDDVEIVTGPIVFNNPEDFENGLGDWYVTRGTWGIDDDFGCQTPASIGTGTNPENANYHENVSSHLASPPFQVPINNPRLRFWHWYSFGAGDLGRVEVKVQGGDWEVISTDYTNTSSNMWTYPSLDLSGYAGQTIQVGFYFESTNWGGGPVDVSSGWYIDDVEIVTGPIVFNNPEDFENGLGDWYVTRGTWGIDDDFGHQSQSSAGTGTVVNPPTDEYHENVSSRLVSPPFHVPSDNPQLQFWHWFSFGAGDFGQVQVKLEGGEWEAISPAYTSNSGNIWSSPLLDLTAYSDKNIQIGFYFESTNWGGGPVDVSSGWYIDDVTILPIDTCLCPTIYDPVCGSNGVTYSNACEAECAGITNYTPGTCGQENVTFTIADNICGAVGQVVEVPVTVENFTDITSFNMSLSIDDPAIAEFVSIEAGPSLTAVFNHNIISTSSATLLWFSSNGAPLSLPDGTVLFTIRVLLTGPQGSYTDISFSNSPTPISVFQDQGGQSVEATPTLINGSVCIDSTVTISGRIERENGDGLVNVHVKLNDPNNTIAVTNPGGGYLLEDLTAGGNYTLTPEKNTGWTNGVTANDLFLIQRHILQIQLLDSPYKMISADADASGSINGNDLYQLQRLILLQIPAIDGNTSWRFVPKEYPFNDPSNPFTLPFSEEINYSNLSTDINDADFYACKIGDIDLSAINMGLAPRALALPNTLRLFIEKTELKAGSYAVIPVRANNFQNIAAYQFTLEFDAEKLSLEGITPGLLPGWNTSNFGLDRANEGLLTTLWYNPIGEGATLSREQELFSLRFKVLDARQNLEELIRVSSQLTLALAFLEDGGPMGIHLAFGEPLHPANSLISHTVIPNPFTTDATLLFQVSHEQQGQIVLFDQFGKTLKTYEGTFAAGRNELSLGLDGLSATGVLFYEIRLPAGNATGRMIRVQE